MKASDENIQRVFQQLHKAAKACFIGPKRKPKRYAFGMAVSFVTTTLAITKQLANARRLTDELKKAQEAVVADAIKRGELKIVSKSEAVDKVYGHLRNCFAHANWSYNEADISKANLVLRLEDYRRPKKNEHEQQQSFDATIDLVDLLDLTEKLLVITFKGMA